MAQNRMNKSTRLRLDRDTMELTFPHGRGSLLAGWQAFTDESARLAGRAARADEDAKLYVLDFNQPSLAAAGVHHDTWRLLVSLEHARYPKEIGWPTFLGSPVPFNPHVSSSSGVLCTGNLWSETTTLAEFVVQVMRLLNFDETLPDRENGLNSDATLYWRLMMGKRPLHPELRYPVPLRPTSGADAPAAPLFGAITVAAGGLS
jgi:hypothetical protein